MPTFNHCEPDAIKMLRQSVWFVLFSELLRVVPGALSFVASAWTSQKDSLAGSARAHHQPPSRHLVTETKTIIHPLTHKTQFSLQWNPLPPYIRCEGIREKQNKNAFDTSALDYVLYLVFPFGWPQYFGNNNCLICMNICFINASNS